MEGYNNLTFMFKLYVLLFVGGESSDQQHYCPLPSVASERVTCSGTFSFVHFPRLISGVSD